MVSSWSSAGTQGTRFQTTRLFTLRYFHAYYITKPAWEMERKHRMLQSREYANSPLGKLYRLRGIQQWKWRIRNPRISSRRHGSVFQPSRRPMGKYRSGRCSLKEMTKAQTTVWKTSRLPEAGGSQSPKLSADSDGESTTFLPSLLSWVNTHIRTRKSRLGQPIGHCFVIFPGQKQWGCYLLWTKGSIGQELKRIFLPPEIWK